MKKIFYIVLVIVALMVISRFVKQGNQTVPSEVIAVEEVVPEGAEAAEAASEEVAVDENGRWESATLAQLLPRAFGKHSIRCDSL